MNGLIPGCSPDQAIVKFNTRKSAHGIIKKQVIMQAHVY